MPLPFMADMTGFAATDAVSISNQSVGDIQINPIGAFAGYSIANDSYVYWATATSGGAFEQWLRIGAASDYDVRCTVISGTLDASSSATGSWLNCASTRSWNVQDTSPIGPAKVVQMTIELRHATTLVVLDSANIDLAAQQQF